MNKIITACLLVRSHRTGAVGRDGNNAMMTWGIVSPIMMQNATMPPKALNWSSVSRDGCKVVGGRTKPIVLSFRLSVKP